MLHDFQIWLVKSIFAHSPVADMMHTAWAWPIAESVHFLGLCLLIGCIGAFDLRLLGLARRVPIAAMHRLIPWGIAGFVLNLSSGVMFVLTEPDQYIYNVSKRTALYGGYAQIDNEAGSARTILGGSIGSGAAAATSGLLGGKSSGFNVGVRHSF